VLYRRQKKKKKKKTIFFFFFSLFLLFFFPSSLPLLVSATCLVSEILFMDNSAPLHRGILSALVRIYPECTQPKISKGTQGGEGGRKGGEGREEGEGERGGEGRRG